MKFFSLLAPLALVSSALAFPTLVLNSISQREAEDIVNKFTQILDHSNLPAANATAQALIANNFVEKSDSINILAGIPNGAQTTVGKQAYINGVLFAPSLTGAQTLKVLVAGNQIVWYWRFTGVGSRQLPIQGFNLFDINDRKQITAISVEFNSIAWGIDIGYTAADPTGKALPLA